MRHRIENAVAKVTDVLKTWEQVDTITMVESGEDLYDPYFFISLDVYCTGDIPAPESRAALFQESVAFEALPVTRKDRFLMDDVPIRVEYKDVARFNEIIHSARGNEGIYRDSGTYMFYRLQNCEVLVQKSEWIDEVRKDLEAFSPAFWTMLRSLIQARMEHHLGDLHASVVREDNLFFLISSAGFVRSLCGALFAINRKFEPSARLLNEQVRALSILPDPFGGRFDSFLRTDGDHSPARKAEIADLMAKSVLSL